MEELSSVLNASHLQDMPSIDEAIAEGNFQIEEDSKQEEEPLERRASFGGGGGGAHYASGRME